MQDSDILMVMSQVVTSAMLDNCLSELPIIYIERDLSHKPWDNLDQIIDRCSELSLDQLGFKLSINNPLAGLITRASLNTSNKQNRKQARK